MAGNQQHGKQQRRQQRGRTARRAGGAVLGVAAAGVLGSGLAGATVVPIAPADGLRQVAMVGDRVAFAVGDWSAAGTAAALAALATGIGSVVVAGGRRRGGSLSSGAVSLSPAI